MTEDKEMKSVIASRKFYKYTELFERFEKEGPVTVLEKATFLGGEPNKFNPDKNDWIFDLNNEEHVLNSCGHLNWQMGKLGEGDLVTAIYLGKTEIEQGQMKGKMAHQWDIKFKRHPENVVTAPANGLKKAQAEEDTEVPF